MSDGYARGAAQMCITRAQAVSEATASARQQIVGSSKIRPVGKPRVYDVVKKEVGRQIWWYAKCEIEWERTR